jgi:glycosyltransferase involved in cell wall biosynthesis
MELSLLIPSLPSRVDFLHRLLTALAPQVTKEVEVIVEMDAAVKTIGAKRNSLMQKAGGEWIAFCDDDDLVAPDYVAEMLNGIAQGADAVCIRGNLYKDGVFDGIFIDQPYRRPWNTQVVDGVKQYLRGCQHLDAVRREIALQVPFREINFGEDQSWSAAIEEKRLITSWHCIDHPVYDYLWRTNKR